jgi:hypothetical protein
MQLHGWPPRSGSQSCIAVRSQTERLMLLDRVQSSNGDTDMFMHNKRLQYTVRSAVFDSTQLPAGQASGHSGIQ